MPAANKILLPKEAEPAACKVVPVAISRLPVPRLPLVFTTAIVPELRVVIPVYDVLVPLMVRVPLPITVTFPEPDIVPVKENGFV